MRIGRRSALALAAIGSLALAATAQADPAPNGYAIQIDEDGAGQMTGPDGTTIQLGSNVTPPPLPGTFILTYFLPADWQVVAGDVDLKDSLSSFSDLIRFNDPIGGNPPTIEVYSHYEPGSTFRLADNAGWPTSFYINSLNIPELSGSTSYHPTPGEPGYVSGLNTSYTFLSDMPAVPEPETWAMMLLGFCAIGVVIRHRKVSASELALPILPI